MVKDKFHIEIEMEQELSPQCKKTSTEYYELLLQIRFTNFKDIYLIKEELANKIYSNFTSINKVVETDKGVDIYFRNKNEINRITKIFKDAYFCEIKRSKKIVGKDFLKSKDIWRHTLLVNIINLKSGMEILYKGEKYIVKSIKGNELNLRDSKTGEKHILNYNIIKDYIQFVN